MRIVITLEYIINLIMLLLVSMHMFQLNSYFFKKHTHWMKENRKKIVVQMILILLPTLVVHFIPNIMGQIITIILMAGSIIYNVPNKNSKIPLKFTNRVIRMFLTEFVISILFLIIFPIKDNIILKLLILNLLSSIICMIVNIINYPLEEFIRKMYIKDAKKKLQNMPNLIVIGITGSYGKTSVKNFLYKTLSARYEVLITPKNYNTTMGVVKTIRENLKSTHQIFICEMGATKVGDIKEICDIVKPQYGIITSIGPQHLESFKSLENVIKTKFELAKSVKEKSGVIFLNYNNEYIARQELDMEVISYGIENKKLDYNGYDLISSNKGLSFKMNDQQGKTFEFKTKVIGKHNIINITAAIAVANYLGIPMENLIPRVKEIQSVEHRLQLISHGNLTIIDDSYNSNPISSKSALDTLSEFDGIKIIVTPGLIELGAQENKYNFELGEYMSKICDYIFLVGEKNAKNILDGINSSNYSKEKVFMVNSPQEAMKQISEFDITDKIVVLLENDLPDNYN